MKVLIEICEGKTVDESRNNETTCDLLPTTKVGSFLLPLNHTRGKFITVKVYTPIKSRLMGSRSMKGTTLCQIPKAEEILKREHKTHAVCYQGTWFDNVPELVRAIFNDLNIIGAETKINGEEMNYADACSFEINSVYLIQIYV